ncbi:hypothetical protein JKF63_03522 [Porcisia hertigi]|uniref:Uncharacterized protein n=1 Tax=Porcisia hertigi TaxID=2761500 RepID=A0A836HWF7_9TRYP|nr:hypothetical protein JKF63_03522 [Porcisia hertigi]
MDKKTALAQLRQCKFVYERGVERQDAERRAKLHRFLDQHKEASQWATSIAALEDAVRHGVMPNDGALCRAMYQCGQRGQLQAAKRVYVDLYRKIGRPRPLTAHVAFMSACADVGEFREAHRQFQALRDRDVVQHAKNASHRPVVNDDLTTEYLRAALRASLAQQPAGGDERATTVAGAAPIHVTRTQEPSSTVFAKNGLPSNCGAEAAHQAVHRGKHRHRAGDKDGKPPTDASTQGTESASTFLPWQVALEEFVALRKNTEVFRKSNELTPLLLEMAAQLACVGQQWQLCLSILRGAEAEQALIPPEAYDAAIRACYKAQRHTEVVRLMEQLIATRVPPDERSVRLALVASEEVSAEERAQKALSSSPSGIAAVGGGARGWSMALTLFQALVRNGFPLYQQSYEAPLRACVNAGRWKEAFQMLDVMRRDHRPVSAPMYAQALACRIEAATTWTEIRRLMNTSSLAEGHASVVVLYLAALRACMLLRDWKHFDELNREMRDRDIPETYDKMRLLIEAAHLREQYHSVLMRFARFENITQYERRRVVQDKLVRLYEEDFELPPALLEMVLEAFEKVKGHADPMVEAAYRAALRHKERRSGGQSLSGAHTAPEEWMYSQKAREARSSPEFQ